jgi:lysophospholipase L1-like esterase
MIRLVSPLGLLVLLFALLLPTAGPAAEEACPTATTQSLALPATRMALARGKKVTIIAFGSSSTEGAGASGPDRAYPPVLEARLRAAWPDARLLVLNRGRGGQEVEEMMERLEADVIAARPVLVLWQAGANAVLRGMAPEAFQAAMTDGIDRLRARGADVVLIDSQRAPRILNAPNFGRFDQALRELSAGLGVPLFSRARLMDEWAAAGVPNAAMLVADGLHHNDRGYACVAEALAKSILDAAGPPRLAGR